MFDTEWFALRPSTYFKILSIQRLRRMGWLYAILMIIAIYYLPKATGDSIKLLVALTGILYPIVVFIYLYIFSHQIKNQKFFLKRKLRIGNGKIIMEIDGQSPDEVILEHIRKIVERKTYWLLYISAEHFIYVPKNAFHTNEQLNEFVKIIEPKL